MAPAPSPYEMPSPLPNSHSSQSFWLSEPELIGHRTTPYLPSEVHIAVIGTGITGASALKYLVESERGLNILALEAREVCWGATGRNGGHLQVVPYARSPSIGAFEIAGCDELHSYITNNNISCEYRALTAVRTFWTQESFDLMLQKVRRLKEKDPEVGSIIDIITDPNQLSILGVRKGCVGALVNKAAATVWSYKIVTHMMQTLLDARAINLQTNTSVESITREQDKWILHTSRGTVRTTYIILATNAYTSHLLPEFAPLIVPARGYVTVLIPSPQNSTPPETLPNSYALIAHSSNASGDLDEDDYIVQRPYFPGPNHKGHIIFGGGHYDGKLPSIGPDAADDSIVDSNAVNYLRKSILASIKIPGDTGHSDTLEAEYAWSGIMGYSRDNRPWVGEVPGKKGVFVAAGYTGHGLPNGSLCAKAIVEMILNGTPGEDVVKNCMLPADYLLTEERMSEAMKLPSLIEDEVDPKDKR